MDDSEVRRSLPIYYTSIEQDDLVLLVQTNQNGWINVSSSSEKLQDGTLLPRGTLTLNLFASGQSHLNTHHGVRTF